MKTKISKRAWSLFLALALVVTAVFGSVTTVKAATKYTTYYSSIDNGSAETGVAGEEQRFDFTHAKSGSFYVDVIFPVPVDVSLCLYDSAGNLVDASNNPLVLTADSSDWIPTQDGYYVFPDTWSNMKAGDYSYGVTVAEDTPYMIDIYAPVAEPKISDTKATITAGFTKKLSVENGTVKSWSSGNKSIAAVDKNGKVTAKKKGNTVITATLKDGSKVKCKVTVTDNKYTDKKITSSDVYSNNAAMRAYSASFDKSGNLVIKARFVNNTPYKVTKLTDIKVVVKDGNGKTVGTFSQKNKSFTVAAYNSKDVSFTIKKANLKKKTADLRNCTITCDGGYIYLY